jgi:hypothetical protein
LRVHRKKGTVELLKLEEALALMVEHHREMGHDPTIMKAIVRQAILKEFGYDALAHVDTELGKMSDEAMADAALGRPGTFGASHLCSNVLGTALRSLRVQNTSPSIVIPVVNNQAV